MALSVTLSEQATNATVRNVAFSTASAGDLLIAIIFGDGTGTFTWAGTTTATELTDTAMGAVAEVAIAYRIATGGETNIDATCSASERSTHIGIRIPAAEWHGTTPPEIAVGASASTANPNPPNLAPSWGSAATRWIAGYGTDSGNVTAYPSGYTDNQTASGTPASAAYGAIATKLATAASDDPGTFTNSVADDSVPFTIAVRPAGSTTITPGALALVLGLPAPKVNLGLTPDAIALTLGNPAPGIRLVVSPAALALALGQPAPQVNLGVAPPTNPLTLGQPAPTIGGQFVTPDPIGLALGQPSPQVNLGVTPGALALALGQPAPSVNLGLTPGAIGLTLGNPAPAVSLRVSPAALALALGLPAPTVLVTLIVAPGALALTLGLPAPVVALVAIGGGLGRIRRIQYHAVVFSPSATGGPGTPKYELDADMLNLVWQQGLNFPGQAAFSLSRFNPKLASFDYMRDHIKIWREDHRATKVVFAGKLVRPSVSAQDAIIYCWDYVAFLQRSRTGFRVLYPEKTIKEIVDAEWALAKAADKSLFEFVTTGTTETPLGLDGTTPIKTNNQFGVIDFDRLYLFYAMAEISMANTSNTVVFEITREEPHTFNFWKNRSVDKTAFHYNFPGNLIDYDLDTGHDQIVNDLATVIVDPTTGAQVEYALTDTASKDLYRRLQSATTIRTLFGLNSGATESDQQKAALARLLTISAGIPRIVTAFPRQGEITPFHNWDLGDAFRTTIARADRAGDDIDAYLNATGIAAAWTPEAGELMQVFLR